MEVLTVSKRISFFKLQYSAAIRVWHWLTFLFITGSMVTVLFVSTLFEHNHPSTPPNQAQGQSVQKQNEAPKFDPSKQSPEEKAAHMYADKIWDVHKIIGFGVCFLLLMRVVIEVLRNKEERLVTKINKAVSIKINNKEDAQNKRHYVLVKWGYVLFYVFIFIMATTGFILAFDHAAIFKNISRSAREIHGFVQYLIYAYILAHIVGVIRSDLGEQPGIVSAMINGGSKTEK